MKIAILNIVSLLSPLSFTLQGSASAPAFLKYLSNEPEVTFKGDKIIITVDNQKYETSIDYAEYDTQKHILRVFGKRYRVNAIEKNYVAEISIDSLFYTPQQIIYTYSDYINPNGLASISFTIENGFTSKYIVTTEYSISIGLANTISFAFSLFGIEGTDSTQQTASFTYKNSKSYSLSFSETISTTVSFNFNELPNNCYVNYGVVANVLEGRVKTYVQEHWFWGIYISECNENKKFQYCTDIFDTIIYKDKTTGREWWR